MYKIHKLDTFGYASNSYAFVSGDECIIIDPSVTYEAALNFLSKKYPRTTISAVYLTHGHYDHFIGLDTFIANKLPIYISESDRELMSDPNKNCSSLFGESKKYPTTLFLTIKDNDVISVGDEKLQVMATPGHTEGSLSFLGDGFVFVGDTIFIEGSHGRCDLPTGDQNKLFFSLMKILSLPKNTVLYTGHMSDTTVSFESNFYNFDFL
jgi:glyoxylase-like metal-dependent hydrolase (beta-lactamase superfamily II)